MAKDVYINPFTGKPTRAEGEITILAGATGGGKSTWIKDRIKLIPLPKKIFDMDNEYREFGTKPILRDEEMSVKRAAFKKECAPLWEHVIVFSEAQLFIDHTRLDDDILEIISGARRRCNFVFFDFHGLSQVNINLLRYFNQLVIKKHTIETMNQIQKFMHYPAIKKAMVDVQKSSFRFEERVINRDQLILKID